MTRPMDGLCGRIVSLYRGWRDWTERTEGYEASTLVVIDDLAPPAPPEKFASREDILRSLDALITESAPWSSSPDSLLRYSHAKLRQSRIYLTQVAGEAVTRAAIERRGTRWVDFGESGLLRLAEETAGYRARLEDAGISRETLANYYDAALPAAAVVESTRKFSERWLAEFRRIMPGLRPFSYEVQAVSDPGPCRNMVVHDGKQFVLRVNIAPHLCYTKGRTEAFALHEVCGHMVHLQQLAGSERVLETAPHLLCIATHTMDSGFVEGVAQYVAHFLPDRAEPTRSLARGEMHLTDLRFLVVHQNLMDVLEKRLSLEQACERHARLLKDGVDMAPRYKRLLSDPFFLSLCLNYSSSLEDYRPLLERPDSKARDEALGVVFSEFLDSDGLRAAIAEILRRS